MNPETYAEWLRRQGQKVLHTDSSYWHSEGLGVYQAFPYHRLITPSEQELRELMVRHRVVALRYSAPLDRGDESENYHVVHTSVDYGFDSLNAWGRKNVRRGLRSCRVGPISLDRYIDEGLALRIDTLARQQRRLKETQSDWRRKLLATVGLAGFEVWASEVNGRLAATLFIFQMDGWGYMLYQQCHRDYLREHVNNALSFAVTQHLFRTAKVQGIFYGMRSLDARPSVDEFKFRMGYEAKPVRQRVVFHPYLAPLVNPYSHRISRTLAAASPSNRLLAKTEGMLRLGLAEKRLEEFGTVSA